MGFDVTLGRTDDWTVVRASGEVDLAGEEPVRTRYLVVWLTALPPAGGGYQGAVAELVVRS